MILVSAIVVIPNMSGRNLVSYVWCVRYATRRCYFPLEEDGWVTSLDFD